MRRIWRGGDKEKRRMKRGRMRWNRMIWRRIRTEGERIRREGG
jgi:hypothetical protein